MKDTAAYIVQSIAALPPLPAAAEEILSQFGDEFIDAHQVTRVVERDPGICAKLLGLANSAYFNLANPVSELEEVVSRVLGVDTVRSLVFAMALRTSFDYHKCPAFDAQRFWLDALCVAEGCKRLAKSDEHLSEEGRNLAYAAGLCHNLGLLALAHIHPPRLNAVLAARDAEPSDARLAAALRDVFQTDHRFATLELARQWSLPEPMLQAYTARLHDHGTTRLDRLAAIIDATASAIGNAYGPEESRVDLDATASRIGLTAEQLAEIAEPGERQRERLLALAATMNG
ncbi:MAG: HDOD domain-containing protein [Pseudomonadota bacterium]